MVNYNGIFESTSRRDSFVVVARVDETGHQHKVVRNMMWEDGIRVYFLTADFKLLYKHLKEDGRVAVTGRTQGAGTMYGKSISLMGMWNGLEKNIKITKSYNLLSRYILHMAGSIIYEEVTNLERRKLGLTYEECLTLAYEQALWNWNFVVSQQENFDFQMKSQLRLWWRRLYSFR